MNKMKCQNEQVTVYEKYAHRIQIFPLSDINFVELLEDAYDIQVTNEAGDLIDFQVLNKISRVQKGNSTYEGYVVDNTGKDIVLYINGGKTEIRNYTAVSDNIAKSVLIVNQDYKTCGFNNIIVSYFTGFISWEPNYVVILHENELKSSLNANISSKVPIEVDRLSVVYGQTEFVVAENEPVFITETSKFVLDKAPFKVVERKTFVGLGSGTVAQTNGFTVVAGKYLPGGEISFYRSCLMNFIGKGTLPETKEGGFAPVVLDTRSPLTVLFAYQNFTYSLEILNPTTQDEKVVIYFDARDSLYNVTSPLPFTRRNNFIEAEIVSRAQTKTTIDEIRIVQV